MYPQRILLLFLALTTVTTALVYAAPSAGQDKKTGTAVESNVQEEAFSPLVAGVEAKINAEANSIDGNGISNSTSGYWSGYWTWDSVNRVWIWTWVWYWTGGGFSAS